MTAEITVKRSRYRAVQGAVYGETRLPPYEKPLTVHPLFAHNKQISPKQINMGSDYRKLTFYWLGDVIVYRFE
jgi:hypothetical protein